MMDTVLNAFIDRFPHALRSRKPLFTALACVFLFFGGLIFTTRVLVLSYVSLFVKPFYE